MSVQDRQSALIRITIEMILLCASPVQGSVKL